LGFSTGGNIALQELLQERDKAIEKHFWLFCDFVQLLHCESCCKRDKERKKKIQSLLLQERERDKKFLPPLSFNISV